MRNYVSKVAIGMCLLVSMSVCATSDAYKQPRLNSTITDALNTLGRSCQNFTLDTQRDHAFEIRDHHQSMTLSHRWSNGDALAFVSHSETGSGDYGQLLAFTVASSNFKTGDLISRDKTMPLKHKIRITEQHPSGIAWLPAPKNSGRNSGYLFIASENERKVRIHQFTQNDHLGEVAVLQQNELSKITDVWLAEDGQYSWLVLHNMNNGKGAAYRALTSDLFQYQTHRQGELNIGAYNLQNQYQVPYKTGCGNSYGQNAQLVKDSTNNWFVVHTYTGNRVCGANMGSNVVKAYPVYFDANGTFRVSTNASPVAQVNVGSSQFPTTRGADGAAGFRVNHQGRLIVYFGAQYAYSSWFDWKSRVRECRSAK